MGFPASAQAVTASSGATSNYMWVGTATMQAITASEWDASDTMWDITDSMRATTISNPNLK